MDERLGTVLDMLEQSDSRTSEQLASALGVTSRTVRTLISQSQRQLGTIGAEIESKPGVGYRLLVHNRNAFEAGRRTIRNRALPSTHDERTRYILQLLLTSRDYVKLDEIAEALFVSRTTISQDLRRVEEELVEYSLLIDRKPYHGVKAVGAEFDIRHCLANHFTGVSNLLNPDQIPFRKIASQTLSDLQIPISDDLLDNLSVHLAAALLRVNSGNVYAEEQGSLGHYVTDREVEVATHLMRSVEQAVGIAIPQGEVSYLALNLAGKRALRGKESDGALSNEARPVVNNMIAMLDETYGFELHEDEVLANALTQHSAALMIRLRFGMALSNPVSDQIKQGHPLAFVMASQAAALLEREIRAEVNEDEVAYIALWLELALQRRRPPRTRRRVLVSCASGLGTARLMEFAFRDRFPDLIESVVPMEAHRVTEEGSSQMRV